MPTPLSKKVTLNDLRAVRDGNASPLAMLTCYDYTSAVLMQQAGVPMLLVGDSAAGVILGHRSTLPIPLSFLIQLTAAVRRGAPLALLVADMPFGSYGGSIDRGVRNVARMVKLTGCDCVKLEVAPSHASLVKALADMGVAVVAHLGLRPQSVGVLGGYRSQGRTAAEAQSIVSSAVAMQKAGAAALLLETVPPEVGEAVVRAVDVPVIGCGAGPACHASVVVTHDALNLTPSRPRFVPQLADLQHPMVTAFSDFVHHVAQRQYPSAEHQYEMPAAELSQFRNAADRRTNI